MVIKGGLLDADEARSGFPMSAGGRLRSDFWSKAVERSGICGRRAVTL